MTPTAEEKSPQGARLSLWAVGPMVLAAGLLSALVAVAFHPGWGSAPSAERPPVAGNGLFVSPDRLDFGQAWESSEFVWTLPIENRNQRDVEIEEFIRGCDCAKVEPRSLLIPAGETREVRLTLDLTPRGKSKASGAEKHVFEAAIYPKLRGEKTSDKSNRWVVRGNVQPLLHVDRTEVDFGNISELVPTSSTQAIRVTSVVPLKSLMATSESSQLLVKVKALTGDGKQYELITSVPRGLPVGPVPQQTTLVAELDGGELVKKILPVTGRVVKDCQSSPPEVTVGARSVGEVYEETLTLYSLTRRPLKLMKITVEGNGLSLEETPGGGEGLPFRVRQRILKQGEQTGKVLFRVRTSGRDEIDVVVHISYYGIDS